MKQTNEEIKKLCFQNGAIKALIEMKERLRKKVDYIFYRDRIEEIYEDLINEYKTTNLISGEELDEAQQKAE